MPDITSLRAVQYDPWDEEVSGPKPDARTLLVTPQVPEEAAGSVIVAGTGPIGQGSVEIRGYVTTIEDQNGQSAFQFYNMADGDVAAVTRLLYKPGGAGVAPRLLASGETNVHLNLVPSGTGRVQENGVAVVLGATGSVDNALVRADGTGTKTIQGGTNMPTVDDSGNLTLNSGFILGAANLVTIFGGEIDVSKPYHKIATEAAAATDDLDTINGGIDGMIVRFRANNTARTVVFKHNTGNMHLDGSADFSLDNTSDSIILRYDAGLLKWLEESRSNNGT